jgi:hypothetical protein
MAYRGIVPKRAGASCSSFSVFFPFGFTDHSHDPEPFEIRTSTVARHVSVWSRTGMTIMAGAPLMVVAINLGHRDTRMVERHYGHLAESYVAEMIRKTAPQFHITSDEKIVEFRR